MFIFALIFFSSSLKAYINDKLFSGKDIDDLFSKYKKSKSTVISIEVIDGYFPVNNNWTVFSKLEKFVVPFGSYNGNIYRNFQNMQSLKYVFIEGAICVMEGAFENCTNLQSVFLKSCKIIYSRSFYQCTSLSFISIPNVEEIHSFAFYCTAIEFR